LKIIISDVDQTLTESRQPISDEIASLIAEILKTKIFCGISGGDKDLLCRQFEPLFKKEGFNEKNFFLSATSGAALFRFENRMPQIIYEKHLTSEEKLKIEKIVLALTYEFWLKPAAKDSGPLLEDRSSQITLSCLGHQAPNELKAKWDPDGKKRADMINWIYSDKKKETLDTSGIDIRMGGMTSLDFLKKGTDKRYGITRLLEHLKIDKADAIFFGDKTHRRGNDWIGEYVRTVQINSISQMEEHLKEIISERGL